MSGEAMCVTPIDAAILSDYWLAVLSAEEEAAVEEHLFTCDSCGTRLDQIIALAEGLREIARSAALTMTVPQSFLDRSSAQGLRIREYAPPAGGSVACTVSADDDMLIGRLAADLSRTRRLDLSICDIAGAEQFRLTDIPFHPQTTAVLWQQSITYAKAAPSGAMLARLLDVDDDGRESLVGEYSFIHTRTMPGPAAW